MKQHISLLAILVMVLAFPQGARGWDFSALATSGQRLYFSFVNDSCVEVTPQNSEAPFYSTFPSGGLTIPDTVNYGDSTYFVTAIGDNAFHGCTGLTALNIPSTVTSIGQQAFCQCDHLTTLTIPASVTTIGAYAFSNCTGLTTAVVSDRVSSISNGLFHNCFNLTSVTLPDSATAVGDWAFAYCTALSSIVLPRSAVSIGDYAFVGCNQLVNVVFPESLLILGDNAFAWCSSLPAANLPVSVYLIGVEAFYGCSSLEAITLPAPMSILGDEAFAWCSSLDTVFLMAINPPSLGVDVFAHNGSGRVFLVCNCSYEAYCNAWTLYQGLILEKTVDYSITVGVNNPACGTAAVVPVRGNDVRCDSTAVVVATENYGYHLDHWSNGNTANPDTLHITGDSSITAFFVPNQYLLTTLVNDETMGTVTGGGTYDYLSTATLQAVVTAEHHHFVQWGDRLTQSVRTVTVVGDSVFTALFAIDTHTVSVYANNSDYGSVSGSCLTPYGRRVTIEATPAPGYYFKQWSNGLHSNPASLTVEGDTTVTAIFLLDVTPQICMVDVQDSHIVLTWDKDEVVVQYNIYREDIVTGDFTLVATQPYAMPSQWVDPEADPLVRSYRYAMTAVDDQGNESYFSTPHNSMHLRIHRGLGTNWELEWTEYEGTELSHYLIYRGNHPERLQLIEQLAAGNDYYTDETAEPGAVYYQVVAQRHTPCGENGEQTLIYSNMATNVTEGIDDVDLDGITIRVIDGHLCIDGAEGREVRVYDMLGRHYAPFTSRLAPFTLPTGVYVVRIGDLPAKKVVVMN